MSTNNVNPTTVTLRILSACSSFQERIIALNCNFPVHIGASGYEESAISTFSSASAQNALFDEADLNDHHATLFPMAGKLTLITSLLMTTLNGEKPKGIEELSVGDIIHLAGKDPMAPVIILVAAMTH
ncbi:hypothetical protein FIBSPDRAFT_932472 [Athelia psychrophila]|uniref:Uncharacterized protein n=1 Tax=Athelia psychrophila TaxID=1759441 RepID=A0A166IMY0_9AGAM|nr:hypothetical protein FIBSPDRAFT_932472 [Fibularhizoctonia sp. CBS 109695]